MSELSEREQDRVDQLLAHAKSWSNWSWWFALAAVVLAAVGEPATIEFQGVSVGAKLALPVLYVLGIVACLAALAFHGLARQHMGSDKRRVPFAWMLASFDPALARLAIIVPLVPIALATEYRIGHGSYGGLTFGALLFVALPDMVGHWARLIKSREDERGGPATFSIWLLYWLRAIRQIALAITMMSPLLMASTTTSNAGVMIGEVAMGVGIAAHLVRVLGAFVFTSVNRVGLRWGFPATSPHCNPQPDQNARVLSNASSPGQTAAGE